MEYPSAPHPIPMLPAKGARWHVTGMRTRYSSTRGRSPSLGSALLCCWEAWAAQERSAVQYLAAPFRPLKEVFGLPRPSCWHQLCIHESLLERNVFIQCKSFVLWFSSLFQGVEGSWAEGSPMVFVAGWPHAKNSKLCLVSGL